MLETINIVLSILGVGLSSYEMVSSVLQGDSSEELLAELQKQTQIQQQTNVQITRLSESILYAPQVEAVRDTSRTVQQIETDNQKVHDALSPIQQALGGDILSSAMIPTPEQMKQIMQADPS